MKRLILIGSAIALAGSLGLAATTPDLTESCQQIETACLVAGFAVGPTTPKGKKLFRDCVQPILDGKTVKGVVLDPAVAAACRDRGKQHK